MAVRVCTGFEFGTATCWANGTAGNRVVDGTPAGASIVTTTPRTGTYCLQLAAAGTAVGVNWAQSATYPTLQNRARMVFAVFLTSSTGSPILATMHTNLNAEFGFNSATGRWAVRHETGGFVDGPLAETDRWTVIELYFDTSAATHTIDWWVDGVAQTQATIASSASDVTSVELGALHLSQTFGARYDDVVVDTDTAAIPTRLGPHKVMGLLVDPAGTVTLSGTAANFNTFTANGTLAAWNATTARNNIDEIPPVFGASSDGFCQITLQTTNYVQIPMTSYALGPGETVTACRMLAAGWATSTTAATIGFRSWNGTTETTLYAAADPGFDNTSTTTAWVCKMLTLADVNTQAEIDALEFRVGFSGDSTPDIGIHAVLAELAVKENTLVVPTLARYGPRMAV